MNRTWRNSKNAYFRGVKGFRKTMAMALKTKAYDIFMIILIVVYTLLIFVFFAFDDVAACTVSELQSKAVR